MPWSGPDFQQHHNHHLGIAQAAHAASVANAILKHTGDEGLAIRTANAKERHRDDGGGITDPTQGAPGSFTPSPQTINPVTQGMIQHYAGLPVEKLQELAGMLGNSPQGQIVQKLLAQKRTSPQPVQATAAPQSLVSPVAVPGMGARNGGQVAHREVGGGVSASQAAPWWTRSQASADARPSGFLAGPTAGRADAVHTSAPGGSYILPADIISGLGEGNSLAGAKIWDTILRTGPWGTTPVRAHGGHGWPSPPHGTAQAKGGGVGEGHGHPTPVALSHGETIVFPDDVVKIGGGNLKRGHRILDAFVLHERKKQVAKISSLPGPVGAKKA